MGVHGKLAAGVEFVAATLLADASYPLALQGDSLASIVLSTNDGTFFPCQWPWSHDVD
jgi:hypothetical protein